MEIEVKLRLPSIENYNKFKQIIGTPKEIQKQKNFYLDDEEQSLAKIRNIARVRVINSDHYVLTWKGKATLENGISRVREEEESIPQEIGTKILSDPSSLMEFKEKVSLIRKLNDIIGNAERKWKIEGYFETERLKYDWEGFVVELDKTRYDFGEGWEIEIETDDPMNAKSRMQKFLEENKIEYSESKRNKYLNLINKSIL